MGQQVLLHIPFGGETSFTYCAFKWTFFGMTSVVNIKSTFTCKCLETDVAACALSGTFKR